MVTKTITISLPENLLKQLDEMAAEEFTNRSDFVRQLIIERLKVVNQYRARLRTIASMPDLPTEEELYRLLRIKRGRRYAKILGRELRNKNKRGLA